MTLWNDSAIDYSSRINTIGSNFFTGLILVFNYSVFIFTPKNRILGVHRYCNSICRRTGPAPTYFGVSFNMISTFAFLLVIGVIVDDAIIVGEAIHARTEDGETDLLAAVNGTNMVTKPVIFAVLTTMIFFAPWMFLSGGTSEFTRSISLVVIFALAFSLIESLADPPRPSCTFLNP